ncbi:M28 family peptidase [Thermoleophilia bacterium SCSIO 60948]|nr:M28 family peptidase [Thermoleophilia bacterium SCSIO 60948]
MPTRARHVIAALAALFSMVLLGACGGSESECEDGSCGPASTQGEFNSERAMSDVERQVAFGPRPSGSAANERQVEFLARQLQLAGAKDVEVQRPWANVTAEIPGEGEGTILIGAHHDTKDEPPIVGANDGASGVAVVLELARSLAEDPQRTGPTVRIALFDAEEARGDAPFEEDGTRGSRQYVEAAERSGELDDIDEMWLFDMVGDCDLQVPLEANSDPEIYERFEAVADELPEFRSPFGGEVDPILDDHIPFLEAGIPSVDLIDFTFGGDSSPGDHWHTTDDTLDKVCPESLGAVGAPALELLSNPYPPSSDG